MRNKYQYNIAISIFYIENLGIDWEGPVGIDDDSTVVIDEVESPLNSEEKALLDLFFATFNDQNDLKKNTLYDKYLFCKSFINIFH